MWPFRKTVPLLVLAPAAEPNIWPFYGCADGGVQFYKDCPPNQGTNKSRLKSLQYDMKVRKRYLGLHRKAVSDLERDCSFLQKAIRVTRIGKE